MKYGRSIIYVPHKTLKCYINVILTVKRRKNLKAERDKRERKESL
jgi:hypothetical protein